MRASANRTQTLDASMWRAWRQYGRHDAVIVGLYAVLWFLISAMERLFIDAAGERVWCPLLGFGFAFMTYFGPRLGWWELPIRLLTQAILWGQGLAWYGVAAAAFAVAWQQILAYPMRRVLLFEGRFTAPRAQVAFLGVSVLGVVFKNLGEKAFDMGLGLMPVAGYVTAVRKGCLADMIGMVAVAPLSLLVICPYLQKVARGPSRKEGQIQPGMDRGWAAFWRLVSWAVVLLAFFLALASGVWGEHYRYWFLTVPILILAMIAGGFELGLWLVPLLSVGLSLLAVWRPTGVPLMERQIFLATAVAFCNVFGALLFERTRITQILQSASQAALAAGEAKRHFMSMVSHELRTPLVTILGCARLAHDMPLSPQRQRSLEKLAGDSAHKMLKLVDRILLLARHPVQDPFRDLRQLDVASFLAMMQSECVAKIGVKPVRCDVYVAESAKRQVYTDPRKLRQVLSELIDNAVKFTERGAILIEARVSQEPLAARTALLQVDVIDSGTGIAAAKHRDVFRLFHQEDQSHSRAFGGMGAGLSYAYLLAESLGGDLTLVRSTLGEGSHFRLQFPI